MKQLKLTSVCFFSIMSLCMFSLDNSYGQADKSKKAIPADKKQDVKQIDKDKIMLKRLFEIKRLFTVKNLKTKEDSIIYMSMQLLSEPFDCRESEASLREHEINYFQAFDYIWNFVNMYKKKAVMGAGVEIPRTGTLDELARHVNAKPGASDNCGILMYMRYVGGKFKIAYHNEANLLSDADLLFPKTSTTPYYEAVCEFAFANPDRITPNELNTALTSFINTPYNCASSQPTPPATVTNSDINDNGYRFTSYLEVLQAPIGFFHAEEIRRLVEQNDDASDTLLKCTAIRIYFGYDLTSTPYKIKLIAFAVDGYGKNIIYKHDGMRAMMIQRSWPPD